LKQYIRVGLCQNICSLRISWCQQLSIYLSIGINVRFAAMMADVGDVCHHRKKTNRISYHILLLFFDKSGKKLFSKQGKLKMRKKFPNLQTYRPLLIWQSVRNSGNNCNQMCLCTVFDNEGDWTTWATWSRGWWKLRYSVEIIFTSLSPLVLFISVWWR